MDTKELSTHITHYIKEDKTHSAIMLTAPWGIGKSHYIKTELIPFLEKEKLGYALISLYGLTELPEISKSLYLELRLNKPIHKIKKKAPKNKLAKWFSKHGKELAHSVVGVGKTIIKGVASFFNVDINFSDKDLQKIFKSIDLTDKLIILEDLERSQIDVIEILGYVNNLVEQDGVKVLLVANEDEILRIEDLEDTSEDPVVKILEDHDKSKNNTTTVELPENARKYLRIKEKTVSDTINYEAPLKTSIMQIMQSFDCKYFKDFLIEQDEKGNLSIVNEIIKMWKEEELKCNLRSFIFACQKTKDILMFSDEERNKDFAKSLFVDNIKFAIKYKSLNNVNWQQITYVIAVRKFGCPVFKINYDYIFNHNIKEGDIREEEKEYLHNKAIREEHIQHNKDFQTLQSFYYKTEKEIVEAIIGIRNRLETSNEIPLTTFGELANYLIAVKYCISCNDEINDCKKLMIEKLKATETDVSLHIQHHSGIELWDDKQKAEYAEFTNLALKANKEHKKRLLIFDYTIESLSDFCSSLYNYQTISSYNEELCVSLDAEKMINLLKQCNALQISKVRGLFRELYKNLGSDNDKNEIIALRDMIQSELSNYKNYDGIQKLQIYWIINDFNRLLNNLDKKQN